MGYYEMLGASDYSLLGQDQDLELLGKLELLGLDDGDAEILGAIRRAKQRRSRAPSGPITSPAVGVRQQDFTKSRVLWLPINSGAVGVGAAAVVTIQPPQPCKIVDIILDPVQAVNFQITGLAIGRQNQNMTAGAFAASVFASATPRGAFNLDTAATAEPIVLNVTNTGGVIATLTGIFLAKTVE